MDFSARPTGIAPFVSSKARARGLRETLLGGCASVALLALPAILPLGVVLAPAAQAQTAIGPASTTVSLTAPGYNGATSFSVAPGATIGVTSGNAVYGNNSHIWTLSNGGTIGSTSTFFSGVSVYNGTVVNSGLISGSYFGIGMSGSTSNSVSNFGTILATRTGRYVAGVSLQQGGTVTNSGTGSLISGGGYGVRVGFNNGTVSNDGTIIGTSNAGVFLNAGTVVNTGTASLISGGLYGVEIETGSASNSVSNFGTIITTGTAPNATGVYLEQAGTVSNHGTRSLISGANGVKISSQTGSVTNEGTILGTASTGVFLYQGSVTNSGTGSLISGAQYGIRTGAFRRGSVTNAGTILATGTGSTAAGVYLPYGTIVNSGSGSLISGAGFGVRSNESGTVVNAGTILATGTGSSAAGVYLRNGTISNSGSGSLISGAGFGVQSNLFGSVMNAGTIQGTGTAFSTGVFLSAGSVSNSAIGSLISGTTYGVRMTSGNTYDSVSNIGTIRATGTAAYAAGVSLSVGSVTNAGTIQGTVGVAFTSGNNFLDNTGTIIGNGGTAVSFGNGNNVLVAEPNGVFQGLIVGGTGTNTVEMTTSQTTLALPTSVGGGTLVNFNNIGAAAGVTLTNGGSFGGQVLLGGAGATVYNTATGSLVTSGNYAVDGAARGSSATVTVTNAGTIASTATSGAGVILTSAGTVNNQGTITGANGVRTTAVAQVTNSGTAALISGTTYGVYSSNRVMVSNAGTITGGNAGVRLTSNGSVSNSGTITGGLFGVQLTSYGTVFNAGTLVSTGTSGSGAYLFGGTLNNTGVVTGAGYGARLGRYYSTLINSGTIQGTGTAGIGVEFFHGGSLNNSGTIQGAAYGVRSSGNTRVTNSGTIQGGTGTAGVGIALSGRYNFLDNTGTIIGNGRTAVSFGNGNNVLVDETNGVFTGLIVGGTGVNTVEMTTSQTTLALPTSVGGGTLVNFNNIGAAAGVTLTNSGTTFGGQVLLGGAGATVYNTATGSLVTAGKYAVYSNTQTVTVTNAGTISSTAQFGTGVQLNQGGSVSNTGTIAGYNGVFIRGSHNAQVTNDGTAGTISGTHYGVAVYGTANTVSNPGVGNVISGGNVGVYGGGITVINAGTISGGSYGVRMYQTGSVTNSGTIIATGTSGTGVYLYSGSVVNKASGSLISGATYGVRMQAGSVSNYGTIIGTGTSGIGVALLGNRSTLLNKLTNSGTIIGNGGTAVKFGTGVNLLVIEQGATFGGVVYGNISGENAVEFNTSGVMTSGTLAAPGTLVSGVTLVNFNSVGVAPGQTLTNSGSFGGGVLLDGPGAGLYNQGTIAPTGRYAVFGTTAGVSLTNAGTLGGNGVFLAAGGSVTNAGTGTITGSSYGIYVGAGTATIVNSGLIQATNAAVYLRYGAGASISNSGIIAGLSRGVYFDGGSGSISNSGTILSTGTAGGTGIYVRAGGTIANALTVSNSGTIQGSGSGNSFGISLRNTPASITNMARAAITGQAAGIYSRYNGSGTLVNAVTVVNAGTIGGTGTAGVGIRFGQSGGGLGILIRNLSNNAIINNGTSTGANLFNTLINSGTIIGNSGTAVQFGGGTNLLEVEQGSTFGGVVDGGFGVSTVQFDQSGTLANLGIGTEYLNFTNIGAGAGATLTNTGSLGQQVQLSGLGASLNNAAGATIAPVGQAAVLGTVAGVSVGNAGILQGGTAGLGVSLMAGGNITNSASGLITGQTAGIQIGAGTATITNQGTILGTGTAGVGVLFASGASGTIDNFGTIGGGTAGNAIRFSGGTNELILESGSSLIGVANGGTGTNTLVIQGTGTLNNAQVTGFQTVIFNNASNSVSSGSTVTNADVTVGTLNNAGTLNGTVTVAGGTTLANSGVVNIGTSSTNSGSLSNSGTLTNSSTFNNTAGLTNSGSLANSGTLANSGSLANTGSLTNTGSLSNSGSLTNTGTITTTGGTLSNTGTFSNASSGKVSGDRDGIVGGGTIANSGTILGTSGTGVQLTSAGTLTNSAGGYIKGGQYGVVVGAGGTVSNAGTILDNVTAGASLGSGATMSNAASGTVGGVVGVVFTGTGASFANNGTITGTGGVAVQFDAGVNGLTLGTGTVLTGSIDGGGGAGLINLAGTGTLASPIAHFGTGSALAVGTGANWTATGNWTIANVTNAGTFQAGTTGAALNLTGNFTQGPTGTLRVALDAGGAGSKFNVTGTAALAGSVAVVPSGTFLAASTPYTILTASGGVTGTFAGGVTVASALLVPTLSYDAHDAIVTLAQLPVASPPVSPPVVSPPVVSPPVVSPPVVSPPVVSPPVVSPPVVSPPVVSPPVSPPAIVETANQHAVAVAFDAGLAANPTGFAGAIRGLDQLNAAGVTASLTRLSGESHASLGTTALQTGAAFTGQFSSQAVLARLGASGTASGQAAMEAGGRQQLARLDGGSDDPVANIDRPWGVWTAGYGQVGQLAGDGNSHRLDETIAGGSVGADYKLTPALRVGAGLGYGGTTFSLDNGGGRGQVDHTQLALYADYTQGPAYLDGTMGVAYGDGTTQRNVSLPGLPGQASGHVTDTQLMASLEAGYGLALGGATLTPFAGLALGSVDQEAFTETGAGVLDLHVAKQSQSSVKSTLGARLGTDLALGSLLVTTDLSVAWAHEFAPIGRGTTAAFVGAPAAGFQVAGVKVPGDSALVGFGLATALFADTSVYLHYDGDLANGASSNAITAGLRFSW